MNRERISYFPLNLYMVLLLSLWLLSWLLGVLQLLVEDTLVLRNLMTAEGVRWALRSSLNSVESAPWGVSMVLVAAYGAIKASGLTQLFGGLLARRALTAVQRRAVVVASVMLLLYVVLLFVCTVAPWQFLLGATADVLVSPLIRGWLLVFFVGVLLVSLSYGYVYGNFRSAIDVLQGVGENAKIFIPALLSLLPATAMLSCMQYMGIPAFLGIDIFYMEIVEDIVCFFPFCFVLCVHIKK